MPSSDTLAAIRQLDTKNRTSVSRPTRNRKNINPKLATAFKVGIEAVGNMVLVKLGIWPSTDGPRRMPPMTSAITRGWRILESGQWRSQQKMMMMPAFEVS
jgi:hypothetical protein